jgi:hypothetical protein
LIPINGFDQTGKRALSNLGELSPVALPFM